MGAYGRLLRSAGIRRGGSTPGRCGPEAGRGGVRQLLKTADVNGSQPDGATALAWAAHWDDVVLADLLLAAGANPNAANALGVTPLMLAAVNGSDRMTERLLKAGGKADAARDGGASVLMLAARSGNLAGRQAARRGRRRCQCEDVAGRYGADVRSGRASFGDHQPPPRSRGGQERPDRGDGEEGAGDGASRGRRSAPARQQESSDRRRAAAKGWRLRSAASGRRLHAAPARRDVGRPGVGPRARGRRRRREPAGR